MKKKATLFILATVLIISVGGVFANQLFHSSSKQDAVLYEYTWYTDEDLTDPTGTYSDINTEMQRLRNIFPAYVFSASHSGGLYQFEFGYKPSYPVVVIYSDLQ